MECFWESCTGSELIGYFKDNIVFKLVVYTISKPSIYKIQLYEMNGNKLPDLFHYLEKTKEIVDEWCKGLHISLKFIEHKIVDIKVPPIKLNFLNKLKSPRSKSPSPKSKSPSPKSKSPSPKSPSPKFFKNHNCKVDPK